ncbi:hemicentin-2 [Caerostris darwini]|uniref:Hemicentin-2 n=1 Tax=Caerostris darwini TaxID=1538125 RepID=A0AAV4P7E3_9ARAC|nr:hemicentin-2 [Caerostris darwini]
MNTDFMSRILHYFFIFLISYSITLTLNFIYCVDPVRSIQPLSIQPPLDSGVTEDPLAALLPHYIKKSNIDPYLTRNVTTQVGQTAYLHCIVNLVGERTVFLEKYS